MSTFDGINANFAVETGSGDGGLGFPALQALTYEPKLLSDKVPLCLSSEAVDRLSEETYAALSCEIEMTNYGAEDVAMHVIKAHVRWIILGSPALFVMHKDDKTIAPLAKGKLGEGYVTATRLFLFCLAGDKILTDHEGTPQIFTLKLTSTKTKLVSGDRTDKSGSIAALNEAVMKHYKKSGKLSMVHLVSVVLDTKVEALTSSRTGKTSKSVLFTIEKAKPLPEVLQAQTFAMVQSEEVKELLRDPFGLDRRGDAPIQSQQMPQQSEVPSDDIPF